MKILFILIIIFTGFVNVSAQEFASKDNRIIIQNPVCYASDKVEKSFIPPPPEFFNKLKSSENPKSDIRVSYSLFPAEAKEAFEFAVSVWEYIIDSPVPIYIQANWQTMGTNVLGSCGPSDYIKNFKNAPHKDIYYPMAVVEKLTEAEIYDENIPDMNATFNKNVKWYFGMDGKTPDSLYDFVSVVMHEIGHGLGITGFFSVEGNVGVYAYEDYGDAAAFDFFVMNVNNQLLLDHLYFSNQSVALKNVLESNGLFANSPAAKKLGGGYKPRLYAPSTWDNGSSVYHLNDATYPRSNENSLMTHAIGKGEAIHNPGPITTGFMADIGWKHLYIDFKELKDLETLQPLTFNVSIKSDYEIDTTSLFVVYSTDGFQSNIDSVQLVLQETTNLFSVEITDKKNWQNLSYYIKAGDKMNRTFTLPSSSPSEYFNVYFGPDTEKPQITHEGLPFYLMANNELFLFANVDDNLGLDTVYVTYAINGIQQNPFGLSLDSTATLYSGKFPLDKNLLNDGDEITYNILARDASVAKNVTSVPFKDKFAFKIEKLFPPVYNYSNNFNSENFDFVLSDFDVLTETGFTDGALHSPHPYPSTEESNTDLNFITILKHPIILGKSGQLSFDEIVLVEPGTSGTTFGDFEFWDYVIVEGSSDLGKTWHPLIDGYDSRSNFNWNQSYNEGITDQDSNTEGTPDMFVKRTINLLNNEDFTSGDTLLIRFRLFSDPFAFGWGWAIDNIQIEQVVSAPSIVLSPGNIRFYPNPVQQTLHFTVQANQPIENFQIDIFNVFGQNIHTIHKNNIGGLISEQIDASAFENGMYLISVRENGKQVYSTKIVKN